MGAQPALQQKQHIVPEKKQALKIIEGKKSRNKAIKWTLIIFIAFFVVISRYSVLTQMNYEIADLSDQLSAQTATNSDLMVGLDRRINLPQVRYTAQTEMGMKMPEQHQIIYVEVPRANHTKVNAPEEGWQKTLNDIVRIFQEGISDIKAIFG